MIQNALTYLNFGAAHYCGEMERYVKFTLRHQLLDASLWSRFVQVFTTDCDDADLGWRCEYWGKMMRGACLIYAYRKDEPLYSVLEQTVRELLKTQRADGRFSSYSAARQLQGWDMWGRKYILTALLHFLRICRSEPLKKEILQALCRHADAILATVGSEDGKIEITKTSNYWLGVNSCSILDAMVQLYAVTGIRRYLDFSEYIIRTGGIEGGNLIALAEANKKMPFEYPETKAYETISFFEGLLSYYQVTGKSRCLETVQKFVDAVYDTDITLIGCAGCTHELFDHSRLKQARFSNTIMQETCVTVTWMRLMAKLHLLTGQQKYFDRLEQSALNAMYGSVNENRLPQYSFSDEDLEPGLPFDSYSPLYCNTRGRGIGGYKRFPFGGAYGCCGCIASAGIALLPLTAVLKDSEGFVLNEWVEGTVEEYTPEGHPVKIHMKSGYPAVPVLHVSLSLETDENFALKIRIPAFMNHPLLSVNGEEVPCQPGYCVLRRTWKTGSVIDLAAGYTLRTHVTENRTAFTYGPLVLAADEAKEADQRDLGEKISLKQENGKLCWHLVPPLAKYHEAVRIEAERQDSRTPLLLTDYASCGKHWELPNSRITVWMNL